MTAKRWILFDTETTGLQLPSTADLKQQPAIIELALIVLEETTTEAEHYGVKTRWMPSEYSWLINPGPQHPVSAEITRITGLKESDLIGKPSFPEILPEVVSIFIGATGLCAHNLPFDSRMLITELQRCGREHSFPYPPEQLCTVSAYHHLKGRNMKLTELYQHVIGKELAQTHRALDDVRALVEIALKEDIL